MMHDSSRVVSGSVFLLRGLILWACLLPIGASPGFAQEDPGLPLLNQAMDLKMNASKMRDLDEVVALCERAIENGLSEGNKEFAQQILSGTLYEKANRLADGLMNQNVDFGWAQRREVALKSLEKALKVDADNAEHHLLMARLQALPGGDDDIGIASADKAVRLLDDNPARRAAARMARAAFCDDPQEKSLMMENAVLDDPDNLKIRRARGAAYVEAKDLDSALEDFVFLLEKSPDDQQALSVVSQILLSQEKYEEAIGHIDKVIEADRESPVGYALRSQIRRLQKKDKLALADLDRSLELDPRNVASLLARSELFQDQEELAEARADVDRALELRPGYPPAILQRSGIYMAQGNFRKALSDLRRLQRQSPNNVPLLLQIATLYLADEQHQRAINTFDQVVADAPEMIEALRGRADAYLGVGDHAKAIDDYEKVLKIDPEDQAVLNNLAWVLATSTIDDLRNGERSIELAKRACEVTDYKAAHILSTLAAGYAEQGDFETAQEWSQKAVDLGEGEVKEQLQAELESYQESKPWRERTVPEKEEESSLQDDLKVSTP